MSAIVWDAPGDRFAEYGLDRGVLYKDVGPGVPWNGLISVTNRSTAEAPTEYFFDGVKYVSIPSFGDFAPTLQAYTYPVEFDECMGIMTTGNGLFFDEQPRKNFGLSYRTMKGNDLNPENGYKIHLVYNASVKPSEYGFATNGNSSTPTAFSWEVSTVPMQIGGYRPTAHLVIDTTDADPDLVHFLELLLYGYSDGDPRLPDPDEMIEFAENFDPRIVIEDLYGGLSPLEPGYGDMTGTGTEGIYVNIPESRLKETEFDGLYTLEEE